MKPPGLRHSPPWTDAETRATSFSSQMGSTFSELPAFSHQGCLFFLSSEERQGLHSGGRLEDGGSVLLCSEHNLCFLSPLELPGKEASMQ